MRIQYVPYIVTKDKKVTAVPLNIRLFLFCLQYPIIPYRKILGNYNSSGTVEFPHIIIPYRKILGNYNPLPRPLLTRLIIPYRKILGNYNAKGNATA